MIRIGIFISSDISSHLPLYCRDIKLVQFRIEALFAQFGHPVIHNQIYDDEDPILAPNMDLAVLVAAHYPEILAARIPCKTIVISLDRGDISLHKAVRG